MDSKNFLLILLFIGIVTALPSLPNGFEDLFRETNEAEPVFGP